MKPVVFDEPNKYARTPVIELYENSVVFHGYQEFVLTKDIVRVHEDDLPLRKKQELINPFFRPKFLKHRSLLDLGANAGFFSFWALQQGAEKVIALDMDPTYLQMIESAKDALDFNDLEIVETNIADWTEPADYVLALALVHWIYSCTAVLGSLDAVVEKLSHLTKYMLLVEWVEPGDPAIDFFHHTDWNKEFIRESYTLSAFEAAMERHFGEYRCIGDISSTRSIYIAARDHLEVDLSGPLPLIKPKETIIYSRHLTTHEGIAYWSALYDDGDFIYKQTTLDLAIREANFLSQFESEYFPRVRETLEESDYSVVVLEKIPRESVLSMKESIRTNLDTFLDFIHHCLNILEELNRKGIVHRDIRPDNILIRDGSPVLVDFGWAVSDEYPLFTPESLGYPERPPGGDLDDVYSMGKVIEQVNQHTYPELDLVLSLMTASDESMRITDLDILRQLFLAIRQLETKS